MDPNPYFTPEKLQKDQEDSISLMHMAAKEFGYAIRDLVPPGRDRIRAMDCLREAVYFSVAAIRLRGDP